MAVLLALTVQIYKLYFSMSAVFLMKDLHLQLEGFESELKLCPVGDLCSYKFFRGMLEVRRCSCAFGALKLCRMYLQTDAWPESLFHRSKAVSLTCAWREGFIIVCCAASVVTELLLRLYFRGLRTT